jgi:predicted O-methyltransferase YrrM
VQKKFWNAQFGKVLKFDVTTSEDLCKIHGMLIWPEAQILKTCARMLPADPVIINIGAGVGTSAIAILEERPDAFIFSVDRDPADLERINLRECEIPITRCIRILGKSWDVGQDFPYLVNMVFVDGDHGVKAVEKDICTWITKILPGGIMAFHDYKHRNVPGLTKVVDSFMNGNEVIAEHRYMIAFRID